MIKKTSGVKSRTVSIPTYTDGKEYIVSLKPGVDYAAFWTEIEADGSGSTYVPNRAVRIINERPGSKRSCHYVLTDAEVVKLKRDSRVDSVVIPSAHLGFLPRTTAVQAGNFNKPEDDSSSDGNFINYGLVRHNSMDNNYGTTVTAPNGYTYTLDGSTVDVVIIDTGIQADHPEFQDADGNSRVEEMNWYNAAGIAGTMPENFYTDIDGHGTHVAGIVAGKTYGWAKNAAIYVMKLNDLSSDQTGINTMEAFDLIIGWHNNKGGDQSRPTVVNMSFGIGGNYYRDSTGDETMIQGGIYRGTPWSGDNLPEDIHPEYGMGEFGSFPFRDNSLDSVIEEMIDAGIHVCIAAGNDGVKIDLPNGPDFNNVFFYDYPNPEYMHTFPNLNEGDTFEFICANWVNQTYYWSIDNITTSNADFVTTSGSFVVTAGEGSFSFDTVEDTTTEGPQEFQVSIYNDSGRTDLELQTNIVTLNDVSKSPYDIVPSITQVSEGGNTIVPNSVLYEITKNDPDLTDDLYYTYFDGSGNFSVPTDTAFAFGTGDFTIECWCYPTSPASGWGHPIISIGNGNPGQEIRICQNISDGIVDQGFGFFCPNNAMDGNRLGGGTDFELNTWHHIALVRNGSEVRLYKDGGSVGYVASVDFDFSGFDTPVYIGTDPYSDSPFEGFISNVRIVKGVAVYTGASYDINGNFTPPRILSKTQASGTNIAAITGSQTSLLTCKGPDWATDFSDNEFSFSGTGNIQNVVGLFIGNTGTTNNADFFGTNPFDGNFVAFTEGDSTFLTLNLKQDRITEGTQTIILKLYSDAARTNVVATAATVTVSDTSVPFISPSNLVKKFVGTSYNDMGQMVIPYNQGSSPYSTRAINVGCLDLTAYNISVDQKADFSEGGPGVDLYACGTAIYSATSDVNTFALEGYSDAEYFLDSDFRQACISGTSMASPQVCGMSTLMLQLNPAATPEEFKAWLTNLSAGNVGSQLAFFLGNDDYTVMNSLWGGLPRVLYNKFNSDTSLTIKTVIPLLGA